ncbi:polynucleotide adenylyltransferase [Ranunculus cassubicifolius]
MSYRFASPLSYEQLGHAINDILRLIKPSQRDQLVRDTVIMEFEELVTSLGALKDAEVEPFGSFLYNAYNRKADLDLSVDAPGVFTSDSDVIAYIWRALVKRDFTILNFAPDARIPLLTFETKRWKIACDVTANNHLGQIKSKFLLWVSKIDTRFCDMVLLVKEWAKAHGINDPKEGTFNSYALCLLVIFHLQTCVPAILPPLKEIYAGSINANPSIKSSEERRIQHICDTNIHKFISTRSINKSTLPQLMVSFMDKFVQLSSASANFVISTYSGKWEDRNTGRWKTQTFNKVIIEDPLEIADNAARTVKKRHLPKITQAFSDTYDSLIHGTASRAAYKACLVGQ